MVSFLPFPHLFFPFEHGSKCIPQKKQKQNRYLRTETESGCHGTAMPRVVNDKRLNVALFGRVNEVLDSVAKRSESYL